MTLSQRLKQQPNQMGTVSPLLSRLEAIRARRDAPRRLYPSKPVSISPFVRMARRGELRPTAIGYLHDGCSPEGRSA